MSNLNDHEFYDDPQFKALMHVMDQITNNKVPLVNPYELAARSTLRALQEQINDHNALDDGELIDVLNQARIEVKYLLTIISEVKSLITEHEQNIAHLERSNRFLNTEITRLERLATQ